MLDSRKHIKNQQKAWLFVTAQAVLLLLLIFLPVHTAVSPTGIRTIATIFELLGIVLILISAYGIRQSLTAMPVPKINGHLQIHGLYTYMRHPMYTGVLLLSLGIALNSCSLLKFGLVLSLLLLFIFKARFEESLLAKKYPNYDAYKAKTAMFIPGLKIPKRK